LLQSSFSIPRTAATTAKAVHAHEGIIAGGADPGGHHCPW
jgi:hypothetical protein